MPNWTGDDGTSDFTPSKTYKIVRHYFKRIGGRRVVKRGLSLEEAQRHCKDPETSSRTCTKRAGLERTRKYGPWFDGYTEERN